MKNENTDKVFDEVKLDLKELNHVYYGNKNLLSNYNIFSSILKKDEEENDEKIIPTNESKLYYNNQAVKQIFKPFNDDGIYRHILSFYPFQRIYIDTMYIRLKQQTLAFINIIDLFSKFAFSKLFLIGARSQAVKSQQSVDTLVEFLDEIKLYGYDIKSIGEIVVDGGSEFLGDFAKYLVTNKIENEYTNPGDKKKTSPVERFNRTLRLFLEKYRVIYGKIDAKVLKLIMTAYNNIPHAKLHFSPIEILKSSEDQEEVQLGFEHLDTENHINSLPVGTQVRILLDKGPFKKIRPVYSSEIYTISKILNGSNYKLTNHSGYFHLNELQPIEKDYLLNEKKVTIKEEHDDDENNVLPPAEEQTLSIPNTSFTIPENRIIFEPRVSSRIANYTKIKT
jgi:hypothetical protein